MAGDVWYADTSFWAGASFVVFVGGVVYTKAHKKIAEMLDQRVNAIKEQINEAQALRDEAEALLGEYQRKQRDAEKEAADMLEQAKADAKILASEAKDDIEALIRRRTRAAEEKIAQAETAAVQEVQKAAVDVAVAAATRVLGDQMKGKGGDALVKASIAEVETKLH